MDPLLNSDNYKSGFLVDEELMAGISQDPESPEGYLAFVLRHTTGEYLGYQSFNDLSAALQMINQIPRNWTFEAAGGCGGCGKQGSCSGGGCGVQKAGACQLGKCGPKS